MIFGSIGQGDRQMSSVHNFWLTHTKFNVIGILDVSMHVVDFGVNMSKVKDFYFYFYVVVRKQQKMVPYVNQLILTYQSIPLLFYPESDDSWSLSPAPCCFMLMGMSLTIFAIS